MSVRLHEGDCLHVLKSFADNSIDSIVTDPPYGLSKEPDIVEVLRHWMAGDDYTHSSSGFMGRDWDSFVPGPSIWREVLRVLKPGGHILCFAGTRTQDLMGIALRMAGFEIRDCIRYEQGQEAWPAWIYATGFPKSLDVAKAIDKSGGNGGMTAAERIAFAKELTACREVSGTSRAQLAAMFPHHREVTKNWERLDSGFRIPSEADFLVLAARVGLDMQWLGKVHAEDKRRLHDEDGVDRRDDGTVYGLAHSGKSFDATTERAAAWKGWGTALKPAWEPVIVARKPLEGNVAQNVLQHGTGALNIDGCRIESDTPRPWREPATPRAGKGSAVFGSFAKEGSVAVAPTSVGRWPANLIHDGSDEVEEAFAAFGSRASCNSASTARPEGAILGGRRSQGAIYPGEAGFASRFFYCAKASRAERDGSKHPTVKPVALMAYLCKLVTPPGGTVLDPFAGSGTTGQGALDGGFQAVLIEREAEYCEHIRHRFVLFMAPEQPSQAE